MEFCY